MPSSTRMVPYVDLVLRRRPTSPGSPPAKKRKLTTALDGQPDDNGACIGNDNEIDRSRNSYSRSPSLGEFSRTEGMSQKKEKRKSVLSYSLTNVFYEPTVNELSEVDFLVLGETLPDDDDDGLLADIPVRLLSDFTIFDERTLEVIPVAQLIQLAYSGTGYAASGLVRPWVDRDSDDEDGSDHDSDNTTYEGEDRLRCSRILEFSIHNLMDGTSEKRLDGKMYIRTKYAWYILDSPSPAYHIFFSSFWVQHRLLHLLINASLDNSRLTLREFIETLENIDEVDDCKMCSSSYSILNRGLDEEDLNSDDVMAYILSSLPDICVENNIKISRVPVIRELMGSMHYDFDTNLPYQPRKSSKNAPKLLNKEKEVLRHQNRTFLTPVVNSIAKDFFVGSLLEAIPIQEIDDATPVKHHHKAHYSDPLKIKWGPSFLDQKGFMSANVDGVEYKIGDVVMVAPSSQDNIIPKASQTINKYGNHWWFCQIRYFFEKTIKGVKTKMFHALWFHHGSKTILQETSHSKALYLLEICDDIHVTAIFKKCNFYQLKPGDVETPDNRSCDSNDFHCSLLYDEEHAAFLDIPNNALNVSQTTGQTCFACDVKSDLLSLTQVKRLDPGTILIHGVLYHVDDFVYVHPSDSSKLLDICQITKIYNDSDQVDVVFLGRYDEYVEYQQFQNHKKGLVSDERKLFYTENFKPLPFLKLDGVCQVLHLSEKEKIEKWIKYDDHYYLDSRGSKKALHLMPKKSFKHCQICHKKELEIINQMNKFSMVNSKLVGMELFCGAGGLGVGMDLSGFVETKYAIEFSPSAAMTYHKNHPASIVYAQDSSTLLKHAITGLNEKGEKEPLFSKLDDQIECPPLPKKNDQIDFIFGGPPCQSFSRANHSKKQDDIRSSLACNMLSYVEHYEPDYFLLENVAGFLDHKFLISTETKSGEVHHEIKGGMVKFVLCSLITLGYQVRYKLLQAGQYGAPQSRRRVIFWGAKRGVILPDFPVPVYAFPLGANQVTLPTGEGKICPPTRCKNPNDFHPWAPLRPRTVDDAINDLPSFDWKNPHRLIPARPSNRKEEKLHLNELAARIPQFDAVSHHNFSFQDLPGFPKGAPYPMPPRNRYQLWLRKDMEDNDLVTGQYTARMSSKVIEATCNVPLKPFADHRDLPAILLPDHAKPGKSKNRVFYGRMDGNGHFKCAVTTLSPCLKNQWPLHPHQKRLITVREAARSQGFPDSYIFHSKNSKPSQIIEDQLRQIGNAVAVPFALALGKELGKAMIKAWEKKEREGSEAL